MDITGHKKCVILASSHDSEMHKNCLYTKWILTFDDLEPEVYFKIGYPSIFVGISLYVLYTKLLFAFLKQCFII